MGKNTEGAEFFQNSYSETTWEEKWDSKKMIE